MWPRRHVSVLLSLPESSMLLVDAVHSMSHASMSRRGMRATTRVAVIQSS
jgi:hypothetical protein